MKHRLIDDLADDLLGNQTWDRDTKEAVVALLTRLHDHEMHLDPEWFGYKELIRDLINSIKNAYGD